jgi:acyl-lipid omega-6 desaturase (Delta-12 desaturase)
MIPLSHGASEMTALPVKPLLSREPWPHPDEAAGDDARSTRTGLSLFCSHYVAYFLLLAGALAPLGVAINVACAFGNGVFIALLFILGHDAAHGSLVQSRKLNRWLARFAFVPCAHAVSLWRTIHHHGHHARTNLKGFDTVWAPMSKAEYDAASKARRWLERIYRGPFGPLIYYYCEFWLHRMLLPLAPEVNGQWRQHLPDCLFALGGLALTLGGIAMAGHLLSPDRSYWFTLLVAWAIPFAIWNYLMAFTTYLNHTHTAIVWFDDAELWKRLRGGTADTVFVRMPINLIPVYTQVMAHTAHHAQTMTPVYHLLEAQRELAVSGIPHVSYTLTFGTYRKIYRACKLFDFKRMCWTDFDGIPT